MNLTRMPLTESPAYPRKIQSAKEARRLWFVGKKTEHKVMCTQSLALW